MARISTWAGRARRASRRHGQRGCRGRERPARYGIVASLSRARSTDLLGCAAARSAALINKLTVKYLRPIGEATTILLEPLSSY
ncbi:unnamed protein product [Arctia plantaginis]|uniref:Uncharacterized protein n=1 Tax=Arctia plantaginis TaxID=874455 RepID=A0A8S1A158_ARCPL|nr:unnamed protein product [Arctia plantaginis]CAB3238948.1 unnamed protein product [Arctia plantaginis]